MKKRRVLIAAIAVCLIAILACGSLAYFTYTGAKVTNRFYTYSTDDPNPPVNPKDLFSIEIYETRKDADGDYVLADDGSIAKFQENTYENVLPGSALHKDPTVQNTGKYDAWVRLRVTITNASAWQTAYEQIGLTDLGAIFQNFNADETTGWHRAEGPILDRTDNTISYVYYSNKPLKAGATSVLFNGMKMPEKLTVQHMLDLSSFQIIIEGDAIQSDNTGNTAAIAFTNCWTD